MLHPVSCAKLALPLYTEPERDTVTAATLRVLKVPSFRVARRLSVQVRNSVEVLLGRAEGQEGTVLVIRRNATISRKKGSANKNFF